MTLSKYNFLLVHFCADMRILVSNISLKYTVVLYETINPWQPNFSVGARRGGGGELWRGPQPLQFLILTKETSLDKNSCATVLGLLWIYKTFNV